MRKRQLISIGLMAAGAGMLFASLASAEEAVTPTLDTGDNAWMLTSTVLVLMMLFPGLALFYGGMVRKKNVLALLTQCFTTGALLSVLWVVVGYSIAFTENNPFFGGLDKAFLNGIMPDTLSGTIPENVFVMFQCSFAIITPAIIIGSFADRMKFSAILWYMALWMLFVYAPTAHMVWGPGGYLLDAGVLDFAGGTVVHINAGFAGLVAAIMVGKRTGLRASETSVSESMAPHNLILTMIGASLLWVGWFGFNVGSSLAAGGSAGNVFVTTHTATAAAVMSWMGIEWLVRGKPTLLGAASGAVAGLVAITPACGFVDVKGALAIGFLSGIVCYWGATWLKHKLGIDDALDCFGVHGVGGVLGAILTGVFAIQSIGGEGKSGLIDGNPDQILTQIFGVGVTIGLTVVGSFIILKVIDLVIGLRVSESVEREGLDMAIHGEALHN